GVAATAAQGAGKQVGTIAQFLRRAFDAFLGSGGDIAGQRSVVQHNGDGSGRKPTLLRHIANCHHAYGLNRKRPEYEVCSARSEESRLFNLELARSRLPIILAHYSPAMVFLARSRDASAVPLHCDRTTGRDHVPAIDCQYQSVARGFVRFEAGAELALLPGHEGGIVIVPEYGH